MKPTKQLIRGLRETAQRLRTTPADYDWYSGASCNCGLLAQTLLGLNRGQLQERKCYGAWSKHSRCAQTDRPMQEVVEALYAVGLEENDFFRIEFLDGARYDDPRAVAAWMDAEADKLEARRAAGEKPETETFYAQPTKPV